MKHNFLRVVLALLPLINSESNALVQLQPTEKEIVIIIPSYNNSAYYQKNLDSVFMQKYENYKVIYIDDCSKDGTGDLVKSYIKEKGQEHRCTVIKNTVNCGPLGNIYKGIYLCDDNAITATLDGDDWFAHEYVLAVVNKCYTENDVWMTYGQFIQYPAGNVCGYRALQQHVIDGNAYRDNPWTTSHLRTCYAWLFKQIKKEDLLYNGKFFPTTGDQALMYPMLEMAGDHSMFIAEPIYIYNETNPLNENRVHTKLQQDLEAYIKGMPKYARLKDIPEHVHNK